MRLTSLAFLVSVLPLSVSPAAAWGNVHEEIAGRASVIDGDTIEVRGTRIRIAGIDAPESAQVCARADGRPYRCGGAAAAFLDEMLAGRAVVCIASGTSYDRIVAACEVGGVDVGSAMVAAGWALDYARYSKGRYAADEARARGRSAGVWQGDFVRPDEWRRSERGR
jgi:endonuclease YncB( thermonuclease family)